MMHDIFQHIYAPLYPVSSAFVFWKFLICWNQQSTNLLKFFRWSCQGEEKLRLTYEKKCRRLRYLDNRGAEPLKIDSARASTRRLQTKISMVTKSVDAISTMMHKIRDDELRPQLVELIEGYESLTAGIFLLCFCLFVFKFSHLNLVMAGQLTSRACIAFW